MQDIHQNDFNRMNSVSTEYVGNYTLESNANRKFLYIVCTSGNIDVYFGGGDGKIPLSTGGAYNTEPTTHTGIIEFVGTGTYTIHEG